MRKLCFLTIVGVLLLTGCSSAQPAVTTPTQTPSPQSPTAMTPAQAIASGQYTVIDVRTPAEFQTGHIKGATNIDYNASATFPGEIDKLPKNGKYVVYCRSGNRSKSAHEMMKKAGFSTVLDGGAFETLKQAGAPTS